jgi:hypothetical protein
VSAKNKSKRPRKKQVRAAFNPAAEKLPKAAVSENNDTKSPAWCFALADTAGPFRWQGIVPAHLVDLLHHLKSFQSMTWKQIKDAGSHNVELSMASAEACKRIAEIKLDDLDELFSLRVTGRRRVIGVLNGARFSFLWWDPDHAVFPSRLKHT